MSALPEVGVDTTAFPDAVFLSSEQSLGGHDARSRQEKRTKRGTHMMAMHVPSSSRIHHVHEALGLEYRPMVFQEIQNSDMWEPLAYTRPSRHHARSALFMENTIPSDAMYVVTCARTGLGWSAGNRLNRSLFAAVMIHLKVPMHSSVYGNSGGQIYDVNV